MVLRDSALLPMEEYPIYLEIWSFFLLLRAPLNKKQKWFCKSEVWIKFKKIYFCLEKEMSHWWNDLQISLKFKKFDWLKTELENNARPYSYLILTLCSSSGILPSFRFRRSNQSEVRYRVLWSRSTNLSRDICHVILFRQKKQSRSSSYALKKRKPSFVIF